jgi:hypothetical protein
LRCGWLGCGGGDPSRRSCSHHCGVATNINININIYIDVDVNVNFNANANANANPISPR